MKGLNSRVTLIIFFLSIIFAFCLREAHLRELNRHYILFSHPVVDASEYHREATSYAERRHEWKVPIHGPLYPILLGYAYRVTGGDPLNVRRLQMVIGFFSVLLIYFGGRYLTGKNAAMISALLLAFYRPAFLFDSELYAEVVTVLLTAAAVLLMTRQLRGAGYLNALFLGLTLGICAISRTNLLLIIPLSALLILVKSGKFIPKKISMIIILIAGSLIPIMPVTWLNYRATGDFILIQGRGGHNLYQANHPGSDGTVDIRPGAEFQNFLRRPIVEGGAWGPKAESDFYLKEFIKFLTNRPVEFFSLLIKKAWNSISPVEVPASYDPGGQSMFSRIVRLPLPGFALLFPLIIVGLFRYPGDRPSFFALCLILFCVWASLILGSPAGRYRYQAAGLLCWLAGAGLYRLFMDVRSWRENYAETLKSFIFFGIGVLVIAVAPGFEEKRNIWQAEFHHYLAKGHYRAGNISQGHKETLKSISLNPNSPQPWYNLGLLATYGRDGRQGGPGAPLNKALSYFDKAISIYPPFPKAYKARAGLFLYLGMPEKAVSELKKALQYWPVSYDAAAMLVQAYSRMNRLEDAKAVKDKFRKEVIKRGGKVAWQRFKPPEKSSLALNPSDSTQLQAGSPSGLDFLSDR